MTKEQLRRSIKQLPTPSSEESAATIQRLCSHQRFMAAHTIMLYSALPDEPATQPLLDVLCAEGRTVLLPRVISDTEMELRQYTGAADLQLGGFGIMEPTGALFTEYERIEVVVVPGMAFDASGHRLGRGRGYYDRFLPLVPEAYKIGLCLPSHLVSHVPVDDHDIVMDAVVT